MNAVRQSRVASRVNAYLLVAALLLSGPGYVDEPAPAPETGKSREPSTEIAAPAEPPAVAPVVADAGGNRVVDRLELDATAITGNRELPKVMSIVPWKPAEPPDGPERPMGSLIEELLGPVDRDEFRREITYYRDLTSQSSAGDAQAAGRPVAVAPERNRSNPSSPPGASIP